MFLRKYVFTVVFALIAFNADACSFFPSLGQGQEPVVIKISDTYFGIPPNYLYDFAAVPAERTYLNLQLPHSVRITLGVSGWEGYGCGHHRIKISNGVDFCSEARNSEALAKEVKSFILPGSPENWERDLKIANTFHLGRNPCGEEAPLSWDGTTKRENITQNDIEYGLNHENLKIRRAAISEMGFFKTEDTKKKLFNIAENDPWPQTRAVAISSLIFLSKQDEKLVAKIKGLIANETHMPTKKSAERNLERTISNKP